MAKNYAPLPTRIKAVIIDGIALIILMYSFTEVLSLFDSIPNFVRILVFVFLFLLYEPLLLCIFGATIGHFFNDIVVKRIDDDKKNLNLPIAIIRSVLKVLLGWVSLLTVTGSENKQAIHDIVAKSIVIPYQKATK